MSRAAAVANRSKYFLTLPKAPLASLPEGGSGTLEEAFLKDWNVFRALQTLEERVAEYEAVPLRFVLSGEYSGLPPTTVALLEDPPFKAYAHCIGDVKAGRTMR